MVIFKHSNEIKMDAMNLSFLFSIPSDYPNISSYSEIN